MRSGGSRVVLLVCGGLVDSWDVAGVVVRLEELHTLVGETDGSGSVERRRGSSLEGVAERCGSGVEELGSFFFEDVGEELGGIDGGRLLISDRREGGYGSRFSLI